VGVGDGGARSESGSGRDEGRCNGRDAGARSCCRFPGRCALLTGYMSTASARERYAPDCGMYMILFQLRGICGRSEYHWREEGA
jgi:hypothetical protein